MLLSTKLLPPPNSEFVIQRHRLFDRLEEAAAGRLTLVTAPAGYGKTTLVADWVTQTAGNAKTVTWLLLDEYDDDPLRFMRYFVAALQKLLPDIGGSVEESLRANLTTPTHLNIEQLNIDQLMTVLINELGASLEQVLLVIDDFHLITNQQILDGIRFWVEHSPIVLCTVLISRDTPNLPIARWRVRRQCTEILAGELCFTTEEAATFVRDLLRLDLADKEIAQLTQRTEGWIAGLQLAALSLQNADNPVEVLERFTGNDRHVLDYLIEEVLQKQPAEIHNFLLQTSILKRLTPALCDSVTGLHNGRERLEQMEKRNLFLIPIDNQREWYRYHPLFAEAIQSRLQISQDFTIAKLHQKAYEWFAAHAFTEEAIEHALAVDLFPEAALCIDKLSQTMLWQEGRSLTLIRWCSHLPEETLFSIPTLTIAFGWAQMLSGQYEALAELIPQIRRAWSEKRYGFEDDPQLQNELAVFEAEVAVNFGQVDEVMRMLDQFDPTVDLHNPATQAIAQQLYGYAYRLNGNIAEAKAALHKAITVSDQLQQKSIWNFSHVDLVETYIMAGELANAEATCKRVLARNPSESLYYFHTVLARVDYLSNRLPDAVANTQLGLSWETASGWMRQYRGMIQADLEYLRGNWEAVQEIIEEPDQLDTRHFGARRHAMISTSRAKLYLLHGDINKATPWMESYTQEAETIPRYQRHQMDVTVGRYQLATEPNRAITTLEKLSKAAQKEGWIESLIEIKVLLALAYDATADPDAAAASFSEALTRAKPERIMAPFLVEGSKIVPLLRNAASQQAHRSFAGQLQAAFLPTSTSTPQQPLAEPLTKRELDVLRMMADGLSNPEIAQQLIIATGTVAKHTNNIFGKLDVRNRTEATQHAQAIGLL